MTMPACEIYIRRPIAWALVSKFFFLLYALYVWYVTGHLPTVAASWSIVCVGPVESIDKK